MLKLLNDETYEPQGFLLWCLIGSSPELVMARLRAWIEDGYPESVRGDAVVRFLESLVRDDAVSNEAMDLATKIVDKSLREQEESFFPFYARQIVLNHCGADRLPVLNRWLKDKGMDSRGNVLRAIVRLRGLSSQPLVEEYLHHEELGATAAELLSSLKATGKVVSTAKTLEGIIRSSHSVEARTDSALKWFKLTRSTTIPRWIEPTVLEMNYNDMLEVLWILRGWTLEFVSARLFERKLIAAMPSPEQVKEVRDEVDWEDHESSKLMTLLEECGLIFAYDSEFDLYHSVALKKFDAICDEVSFQSILEYETDEHWRIQFICGPRLYRYRVLEFETTKPLFQALDLALEHQGSKKKLVRCDYYDERSYEFLFGDPKEVRDIARESFIRLAVDPDYGKRLTGAIVSYVEKDEK